MRNLKERPEDELIIDEGIKSGYRLSLTGRIKDVYEIDGSTIISLWGKHGERKAFLPKDVVNELEKYRGKRAVYDIFACFGGAEWKLRVLDDNGRPMRESFNYKSTNKGVF